MHSLRIPSAFIPLLLLAMPSIELGPYTLQAETVEVHYRMAYSVLLSLSLFINCYVLGTHFVPLQKNKLETEILAIFCGAAVISFSLCSLALFGALSRESVQVYHFALSIYAAFRLWVDSFSNQRALKVFPLKWLLFVLCCLGLFQACFALLPTTDYDDASHQLELARVLLEYGDLRGWQEAPPWNYPAAMQLLYAIPLAFGVDAAARLFTLGLALSSVLSMALFGRQALNLGYGILAAYLFLSNTILWELAITSRVDLGVMVFSFATIRVYLLSQRDEQWVRAFYLLAGMTAAIKLTGALMVTLPLVLMLKRGKAKYLLFMIPAAIFYGRNIVAFGTPIYPGKVSLQGISRIEPLSSHGLPLYQFVDKRFQDTSSEELFEALGPQVKPLGKAFMKASFLGRATGKIGDVKDLLLNQGRFARKPYHYFNFLLILSCVVPLWWRCRWLRTPMLFSGLYLFVMSFGFHLFRYYLPALPWLSMSSAAVLESVVARKWKKAILYLSLLLGLVPFYYGIQKWTELRPDAYLSGQANTLEYLSMVGYSGAHKSYPQVLDGLNRARVPGVLMIGESKTFHLQTIDVAADYEQQGRYAVSWLRYYVDGDGDFEAIAGNLREDGKRYIVFNWSYYLFVLHHEPLKNRERLRKTLLDLLHFLETHTTLLLENDHYWVAELKDKGDVRRAAR